MCWCESRGSDDTHAQVAKDIQEADMVGDDSWDTLVFVNFLAPVGSQVFAVVDLILSMLGVPHGVAATQDYDRAKDPERPIVSLALPSW